MLVLLVQGPHLEERVPGPRPSLPPGEDLGSLLVRSTLVFTCWPCFPSQSRFLVGKDPI